MRKTFLVALAALLLAGGAGYFGLIFYADHEARRQLDALVASLEADGITARHGAVAFDLFDRRLEVKDLSVEAPGQGKVRIAALTARGLDQPAADRVAASEVEIRELEAEGPLPLSPGVEGRFTAPLISVADFVGPTQVAAAANQPWPLALAVVEATRIGRIDIPASTSTTASGQGETRIETDATYGPTTLERLDAGKIARLSVESTVLQIGGSPAVAAKGEMGPLVAEAVDLVPALVLLDPERRPRETAFRTLYGAVRAENYRFTADNGTAQHWAKMEIRDIALQPSGVPAEQLIETGTRLRLLAAEGKEPEPHEVAALLTGLAGTYEALRFGGGVFEGLESKEPDGSTLGVKAIRLGRLENGRLDLLAMEDMSGTMPDGGTLALQRLALGGLRPGTALRVGAQAVISQDVASDPASLVALIATLASLDISGAQVTLPGTKEPTRLDTLSLSWDAAEGAVPSRLAFKLRGSGPTAGLPEGSPLALLVPDDVSRASLSLDLAARWNPGDKTVLVDPVYAEMSDSFALHGKARLGHVEAAAFSPDAATALGAAMVANVDMVQLTLTDSGLYDRKLAEAAREQGVSPQMLRQLFAGFAEMLLGPVAGDRPDLDPAVQALVGFLQKPMGTLSLRLTPRTPPLPLLTAVEALRDDPTSLIDRVNIQVVNTP
ncbi:hypothetical protein [Ancylobacter oerskovii]|uniref:DUF748 domain-containing protein n=1 Tax=Ancylobacter oerskovii TaxID=459519 RepID=A0ABW4Z474_9HYPH|nr:hypothetical protein [Ancylobacter oerskovii]MBS7545957.1 hypothetical protein [Ancylobacter oerskovii]